MKTFLIIVGAILVFFLVKGIYDSINNKKSVIARMLNNWGKVPQEEYTSEKFESLAFYYKQHKDDSSDVDDITWNDLDMDEVYMTMNQTCSPMGEEYLYSLLRKPVFQNAELDERNRLMEFFTQNETPRTELQYVLSRIGKIKTVSLYEYMNRLNLLGNESNLKHFLMLAALPVSVGILFFDVSIGVLMLIATVLCNVISYFACKAKVEKYYSVVICIMKTLNAAKKLKELKIPEISEYLQQIEKAASKLKSFNHGGFVVTSIGSSGNLGDIMLDYIRILTHVDLIKFNHMLSAYKKNIDALNQLFETIGFLDSMLAAASFRELEQEWCRPELSDGNGKPSLQFTDIYHPLITEPVKNSISISRSTLITGSNASGKSTFIKTVAINAILAQTIATCTSSSYRASFFKISSSMALQDNLTGNESYYIVEIKSLKRILDRIDDKIPTLCFIDEVLRGTNTIERIAASSRILLSFAKENCICFAATHDLELTEILENHYENFHFQEQITEGDILFDYKLREGRAVSKNAIKLLEIMGYSKDIIDKATAMAEHFEATRSWEKQA